MGQTGFCKILRRPAVSANFCRFERFSVQICASQMLSFLGNLHPRGLMLPVFSLSSFSLSRAPHEKSDETSHEGVHRSAHESVRSGGWGSPVLFSPGLFLDPLENINFPHPEILENYSEITVWPTPGILKITEKLLKITKIPKNY